MRPPRELDELSWRALALHLHDPSAFAASCRRARELVAEDEFRLEWFAIHHRSVTRQQRSSSGSSTAVTAAVVLSSSCYFDTSCRTSLGITLFVQSRCTAEASSTCVWCIDLLSSAATQVSPVTRNTPFSLPMKLHTDR